MSSLMYFTKGVVLEYHKRKVDLTNPWSFLVHIIHNIVVLVYLCMIFHLSMINGIR